MWTCVCGEFLSLNRDSGFAGRQKKRVSLLVGSLIALLGGLPRFYTEENGGITIREPFLLATENGPRVLSTTSELAMPPTGFFEHHHGPASEIL